MDKRPITPPIKSILKSKSKPTSADPMKQLKSSSSNPVKARKTVEINAPLHVVKSQDGLPKLLRETPLPRVAFLARQPQTPKQKSKHNKKKAKKTPSKKAPSSNNSNKPLSNSTLFSGNSKPTTSKKVKSAKKLKKKSKSTPQLPVTPTPIPSRNDNSGEQYMKELGTINELLRSVTDQNTHNGHENELIEGFIRPFSSGELNQLIKSIGNVASIHNYATGASAAADAVVRSMKAKTTHKNSPSVPSIPKSHLSNVAVSTPSTSKSNKRKKSQKSNKAPSNSQSRNSSSVRKSKSKGSINNKPNKSKSSLRKSKSSTSSHSTSSKTYNQNESKNHTKSKSSKSKQNTRPYSSRKRSARRKLSDSNLSELSELDLVKSAMLNKRYYEESLAMERMSSEENVKTKSRKSTAASKKRSKSIERELKKFLTSNTPSPAEVSSSGSSSRSSSKSNASARSAGEYTSKGIKPMKDALEDVLKMDLDNYKTSMNNVLINYSHVLREPDRKELSYRPPTKKVSNNTGFETTITKDFPHKREVNLDEISGFDKHLERLKYHGPIPVAPGLLDVITPLNKPLTPGSRPTTPATAKYLRQEQILENTRSKATTPNKFLKKQAVVESPSVSDMNSTSTDPPTSVLVPHHKGKKSERNKVNTANKYHKKKRDNEGEKIHHPKHFYPKIEPKAPLEPEIVSLTKPLTDWKENSLSSSIDHNVGGEMFSRWSVLNKKTLQKSRDIRERSMGRRKEVQKEDLDDIRRQLDASDERKIYLEKLDKAREAYDTYTRFYDVKENSEAFKGNNTQPKAQKTAKPYEYAFDPHSSIWGKSMF